MHNGRAFVLEDVRVFWMDELYWNDCIMKAVGTRTFYGNVRRRSIKYEDFMNCIGGSLILVRIDGSTVSI